MKFWQKLYLSTLSMFLAVFVSSMLMVVHSIYRNNLDMEKAKGNRDSQWLADRLSDDFTDLAENQTPNSPDVLALLSSYSYDYTTRNLLFSLYENEDLIYTTLSFEDVSLLPEQSSSSALSRVYWMDQQCFYCIYLPVSVDSDYRLLYLYELTGFYPFLKELAAICLTAGITGSVLLAFLLYFLVKLLTKPLENLEKAARKLASHEYDTRVNVKGQDEFASISRSVNEMAGEVSRHILSLEEENEKKQIFTDNLAHEMRTPLTSIQGYGEYLQRGRLTEEERYEALSFITHQARRLSALGNQLLLLTNLREGDFNFISVSVPDLVHTLEALFARRTREKQLTLTFSHTISCVTAEPFLLESLVSNLIENSIRACSPKGRITVSFLSGSEIAGSENAGNTTAGNETAADETAGNRAGLAGTALDHATSARSVTDRESLDRPSLETSWQLQVTDNGIGIREEVLPFLTDPFYRTDKARSRAHGGAGLGLTLVQQIALLHHGVLSFSSKEQSGTCVTITFATS